MYFRIEYNTLWVAILSEEADYLMDEDFKNTILGCLWKKSNDYVLIKNDLCSIIQISLETNENWNQMDI